MGRAERINLALQGGGAHGAFTWGVIDRLLDEPEIEIAGISGTSAGAMNGAALKVGLARGSREAARENLDWLWTRIAAVSDLRMTNWMASLGPGFRLFPRLFAPLTPYSFTDALTRMFSPYDLGWVYRNPLAPIVAQFRFDEVCSDAGPALFVSATNVRTGKIRVFSGSEISDAAILASTCLPTLFRAIELVDPATGTSEAFWDGGYAGNPALFPLFDPALPDDIVIVNINPLRREEVPRTAQEIQNRINEISFNSSLLRELRAINFAKKLIADGKVTKGAMKDVLVHMIADDVLMTELSVDTKLSPTPVLLNRLKLAGRAAAEAFLQQSRGDLGRRGSVDLPMMFG